MGCISSKKARSESPPYYYAASSSSSSANTSRSNAPSVLAPSSLLHVRGGPLEKIKEEPENEDGAEEEEEEEDDGPAAGKRNNFSSYSGNLKAIKGGSSSSQHHNNKKSVFSLKFGRLTEGEHAAAGWPAWLCAVAGDAIDGWLPLRSESFKRLEKIGQGTYSDVYRARNVDTGKIFAVKKVRFDNFQPESVRFMAREILILRKLDHPNVMKLEGIITSRLSCHIYLVFEYMEHDLAGLLSCPDIKFTDSQIKCYMRQLLCGLEHCHSRGILHRDIKTSNILVNNEGVLKIADFGLANFMRPKNRQPLTSRVVTLWYRPPELLMGSTNYGEAVDLWSVGCVFAELFIGRPLFKGRTEVEQLHKIFKLCGSPAEDYWQVTRLPLANMFKPQQPYESTLRERCKELPKSAVNLIETFLSIEPYMRGTASSALDSKYFTTKPYACDPASLPKYPPNKEIDAKYREDARRKKAGNMAHAQQAGSRRRSRKPLQEPSEFFKVVPTEAGEANHVSRRTHGGSANAYRRRSGHGSRTTLKQQPYDTMSDASQLTAESQASHQSSTRSVPVLAATSSSNFEWPKRQRFQLQSTSTSRPSSALHESDDALDSENDGPTGRNEAARRAMLWEQEHSHRPDSLHSSGIYESQELYEGNGNKKKGRVAFSGPMIYQSQEIDSIQHDQSRHVAQRSRFSKDL
ncbi:hypothetical protein ABFS82_11G121300 [Erythranthe guttata]|uniref:probable serine/threonine-protein kinase At1g54610 n=1 Tax=Erythranthe guttata TaxID=4155 RepID=UPI00064E04D0|nr:PREDICTED: probable serine/threonine-protein kinase At1g54610 [Erythranthe guttata]|eukprot:XP_012840613.1 PREDICTED: probable serine/threonine-protein kinase At1g54610 [Erythranthe guttata]